MSDANISTQWVEDICNTDGGYSKVVVSRLKNGLLQRERVALGTILGRRNRSMCRTNLFVEELQPDLAIHFGQPALRAVPPSESAELLALWNIPQMGRNKLWELKERDKCCLIDSVTLIESCIVPFRRLLPFMLTPLRHALARVASDDLNNWFRPKSPRLIGCQAHSEGLGIPWYLSRQGVSAVHWWLSDRERGQALDRFAEEMLSASEIPLPIFPPFHSWHMKGDRRGDHLLVTELDVHFEVDVDRRALWVLPDDTTYGLRFENLKLSAERSRVSSTFVSPDQRSQLQAALSDSFDAFQKVSAEIRAAELPPGRLQIHEVVNAVQACGALKQKDYYCALAWLIGVGLWIPSRVGTLEIRDYIFLDGTLTKEFQHPELPYWPELVAAVDCHLDTRPKTGTPDEYRGHRPEAKLLDLSNQMDRGLTKREILTTHRAYKTALVSGLSPDELRRHGTQPMRVPKAPAPKPRKRSFLLVAQWLYDKPCFEPLPNNLFSLIPRFRSGER